MQSLDGLTVFIHVVEQNSFSAAADKLMTSKANVSRKISRLESSLGVQLLQRSTRQIHLTEVGQTLYHNIKGNIDSLNDALLEVMDMQAEPRGTLRISAAGLYGETKVAKAAARFMQQYEEVKIELIFSDRNVDIISEGFDLAIRAGELQDSNLIARHISSRRLILCTSPLYIDRYGIPKEIIDLKHHHCLKGASPVWYLTDKNRKKMQYKVHSNWVSNNAHATLQACIEGLGIAQLPEYYVEQELKKGVLKPVLEDFEPADNGIWAVYANKFNLSNKVSLFIDFLLEE